MKACCLAVVARYEATGGAPPDRPGVALFCPECASRIERIVGSGTYCSIKNGVVTA